MFIDTKVRRRREEVKYFRLFLKRCIFNWLLVIPKEMNEIILIDLWMLPLYFVT